MARGLTTRQQAFVSEYTKGLSAAVAARNVGYSGHYASRAASHLLGKPAVKAAVAEAQEKAREAACYTVARAMAETDEAMVFAREQKNSMALAKLLELRAKLCGLLIQRIELNVDVDMAGALAEAKQRANIIDVTPQRLADGG